jgi:hypothetical protein
MSLYNASGQPLSSRRVRESVEQQQVAMILFTKAFSSFLNLSFVGRLRWILFGARAFKPTQSLAEQFKAEREAAE